MRNSIIAVAMMTIIGLAAAFYTGLPLAAGFSAGLLLLATQLLRIGVPLRRLLKIAVEGMLHTKEVVLILLFVGLLIPSWTASGTITYMIGLGLDVISPTYYATSSFLLTSAVAFLLGTSTGTLSAIGIPLIGLAAQLDLSLAVTAGALVSGAFVGERISPFSSAFRLVADSTGVPAKALGRALMPTTLAGSSFTLLFFVLADRNMLGAGGMTGVSQVGDFYSGSAEPLHLLLLIPPILLIGVMLLRLGFKAAFILAITASIALGSLLQHIPWLDWFSLLWSGYTDESLAVYSAKGVSHMIELVVLIALAGAFNGMLEHTGALEPLIRRAFASAKGLTGYTWRAGLFGLALSLVSCTQTLPIMMTGRHLLTIWEERFERSTLGRVVADTSLLFAALIPWNMLGILCATILDVPVTEYLPFAVYLWSIPIFNLLYAKFRYGKMGLTKKR
jgi:NhaC family Na+:H+ antiporter